MSNIDDLLVHEELLNKMISLQNYLFVKKDKKKIVKYRRNLTFVCIFNNILLRTHINIIFHIIISLYHKK